MGFIRGFFLFLVAGLLFVSLLAGNVLLTLTLSLTYDNVNAGLSSTVADIVQGEVEGAMADLGIADSDANLTKEVEEAMETMREYCGNNTDVEDYVFSYEDYTFVAPCESVEQGTEAVIEKSIENLVDRIYYKEYDCEFWACLQQGEIYVLVSEKARVYWKSKFYISLIASIILAILAFLLTERKKNFPIILGVFMIVSALPFVKAEALINSVGSSTYLNLATVFISGASKVFWIMFISGLILLGLGILLHFIHFGTKIAEKLDKKKEKLKEKKEVKKEIEKE